jgi:hypothetical protein
VKTQQIQISELAALTPALARLSAPADADLALIFGSRTLLGEPGLCQRITADCPRAILIGCSTAGEITDQGVADDTLVLNLVHFDRVRLTVAATELTHMDDSRSAGQRLGAELKATNPHAIVVLGPGVAINGSALIEGLHQAIGDGVTITGGLAGDGSRFQQTLVMTPAGPSSQAVVALGLSGEALCFNHGIFGGWFPFGTLRKVTKASGNVLFELDHKPALDIYRTYLGDYARDLPSSALLFPFEMHAADQSKTGLIRSILGIDEADGSLTLAGDIDPDGYLQLMHSSADRLINGAETAATAARDMTPHPDPGLALLVSCVGRKLVLGVRVDEEIEAVADILGRGTVLTGFYSYGEFGPLASGTACQLHNQTMTITWIGEAP